MKMTNAPRKVLMATALVTAAALTVAGCSAPKAKTVAAAPTTAPSLASSAVTLHILDVAGDLTTSKPIIENFVKANPKIVSNVEYETGSASDVVGKLQAQQTANKVDIDIVLTGPQALSQMTNQGELTQMLPAYNSGLPDLSSVQTDGAKTLQKVANGYGVLTEGGGGGGPTFEYSTKAVPTPPKTPDELLAWAKANPGKFTYANPTSGSGPANAFVQSLPYALGDSDPTNPTTGWTKTWAYLQELNKYIKTYPAKTADTFTGEANGTYTMVAAQTGWDVQEHSKGGALDSSFNESAFTNPYLLTDGHFVTIPKGVSADHIAAVLALTSFMLKPEQQALTYPVFSSFPVKGVTLSMATPTAQAAVKQFGRPDFTTLLNTTGKVELPLGADQTQAMYDLWSKNIGAKK